MKDFNCRRTAALLRNLGRGPSGSDKRLCIGAKAAGERHVGVSAAELHEIRSRLESVRTAAIVCVDVLNTQRADLDTEIAATLNRNVCREIGKQILRIDRLIIKSRMGGMHQELRGKKKSPQRKPKGSSQHDASTAPHRDAAQRSRPN